MNWKKISIERLKAYEARQQSLILIPAQLETLEMSLTAIRSATTDSTPVTGGNGNKREESLLNNIIMREELKENLKIAEKEVEITERGLKHLTREQRRILEAFYIHKTSHGHVERLCDELYLERSRVYELKDDALKIFTIACYGIVEI